MFLDRIPWLNEEDKHLNRAMVYSERQVMVVAIPTDERTG